MYVILEKRRQFVNNVKNVGGWVGKEFSEMRPGEGRLSFIKRLEGKINADHVSGNSDDGWVSYICQKNSF